MEKSMRQDGKYANHYQRMVERHRQLNRYARKGQIVFAGSSLMEQFPIEEMAQQLPGRPVVYNRGIGGDTLAGFEARLDSAVTELAPAKLFINIGTNDISAPEYCRETMLEKYRGILRRIRRECPQTQIIVMSYYPVNRTDFFETGWFRQRTNAEIDTVNACLREMAAEEGLEFVNVTDCLRDEEGNLPREMTVDGMHMLPEGYARVLEVIRTLMN